MGYLLHIPDGMNTRMKKAIKKICTEKFGAKPTPIKVDVSAHHRGDDAIVYYSVDIHRGSHGGLAGDDRNAIGYINFTLMEMPVCRRYLISYKTDISNLSVVGGVNLRGIGLGTLLQKYKLEIAKYNGASKIICTVNANNIAQLKIMVNNGWTPIDSGHNFRSNTEVIMYMKDVGGTINDIHEDV